MARVKHNPITSLWHGQAAGHQYRVVRGKQVIAGAVSSMGNKNAPGRVKARARFSEASTFASTWLPVAKANLRKVENDAFVARGLICSVATESVDVEQFAIRLNMRSGRHRSTGLEVDMEQGVIVAKEGDVVVYEVVGWDAKGSVIHKKTMVYVSDGSAREVELYEGRSTVVRYGVMAFDVTMCNTEEWKGPVGKVEGKATKRYKDNSYNRLLDALTEKGCRIHGMVGSEVRS